MQQNSFPLGHNPVLCGIGAVARPATDSIAPDFERSLRNWQSYLVVSARKYAKTSSQIPELEQAGKIALWRATRAFNENVGVSFPNFARSSIKNAMLQSLRESAGTRSKSVHLVADIPDAASPELDPLADLEHRMAIQRLTAWAKNLPEPLNSVYRLLYKEELSQSMAARALGLSQPRISQLHRRLLALGRVEVDF